VGRKLKRPPVTTDLCLSYLQEKENERVYLRQLELDTLMQIFDLPIPSYA